MITYNKSPKGAPVCINSGINPGPKEFGGNPGLKVRGILNTNKQFLFVLLMINSCGYENSPVPYLNPVSAAIPVKSCTCQELLDKNKVQPATEKEKVPEKVSGKNMEKPVIKEEFSETSKASPEKIVNYIVKKMIEADQKNEIYQATFTRYSKGEYYKGKKTGIIKETTIVGKMTLKKNPLKVLLNVIDSPETLAKGSTLLYTGGDKVKVKAGGVLGLFPINFDINDPLFSDSRNHQLLSATEGLKRFVLPSTKIELVGQSIINNKKVYMLKVISPEKPDPEITHEIYGVDAETFIVLSNEMFINEKLVAQYKVNEIKINLKLNDDLFTL